VRALAGVRGRAGGRVCGRGQPYVSAQIVFGDFFTALYRDRLGFLVGKFQIPKIFEISPNPFSKSAAALNAV
jgi:hypothetical protein